MTKANMLIETVQEDEEGMRLDRWLKVRFPAFPQAWFERALRKKWIQMDGKRAAAPMRLLAGAKLSLPGALRQNARPSSLPLEVKPLSMADKKFVRSLVLHKDKDIIIVNKPAGLATQGGHGEKYHLDMLLDGLIYEEDKKKVRPRLVHRLDKETSGLLILARTRKAAQFLGEALVAGHIHKTYIAWVEGSAIRVGDEGVIDIPLVKEGGAKTPYAYVKLDPEREHTRHKEARTHYRVEAQKNRDDITVSKLSLTPHTGRTHQLRVHLAKGLGAPIIGDTRYGFRYAEGQKARFGNWLYLHAYKLAFTHPSGQAFAIEAPLPEYMVHINQ